MNTLLIYDSTFGNTKKIAHTIGETINCRVLQVGEIDHIDCKGLDLLIIGSPTHGGQPTPKISRLLESTLVLEGVNVAAFDTRTERFSRIFGYAASKIAQNLENKGGILITPPEGFIVIKNKGPLKDGELSRAEGWAKLIIGKSIVKD